jgi:hypothetical protein
MSAHHLGQECKSQSKLRAALIKDEKKLESPAWHGAVLKEREEAYAAGKLTATDWGKAKKRIKKKVL